MLNVLSEEVSSGSTVLKKFSFRGVRIEWFHHTQGIMFNIRKCVEGLLILGGRRGGGGVKIEGFHYYPILYLKCRTWPGPAWSVVQSLRSILLSIQTLLNEKPYHNEPGYEQVEEL